MVHFGVHSLRRSFVTRTLVLEKGEDWVRQRIGHVSSELLTYRQAATARADWTWSSLRHLPTQPRISERPPAQRVAQAVRSHRSPWSERLMILLWCAREGSNLHELPRWNLNPVRLPIPPLAQGRRRYPQRVRVRKGPLRAGGPKGARRGDLVWRPETGLDGPPRIVRRRMPLGLRCVQ